MVAPSYDALNFFFQKKLARKEIATMNDQSKFKDQPRQQQQSRQLLFTVFYLKSMSIFYNNVTPLQQCTAP